MALTNIFSKMKGCCLRTQEWHSHSIFQPCGKRKSSASASLFYPPCWLVDGIKIIYPLN